jgi:hypothetical protein
MDRDNIAKEKLLFIYKYEAKNYVNTKYLLTLVSFDFLV